MLRSRYAKGAVLVLAVLILAIEGYFGYQWYQRYYGDSAAARVSSVPSGGETSGSGTTLGPDEASDEDRRGGAVALVHRATAENIAENSTYVDHPASNGNPDAVILITPAWEVDGIATNARPTGVWYDESRGRWAIFNQDLEPMPENARFNVVISEEPGGDTFVHRAVPANTDGETTYVDHPSANAAPDAVLLVTQNWNPGGGPGTYNDHPVGVRYDAAEEKWMVRNEDRAPLPAQAAFGVSVRSDGAGG